MPDSLLCRSNATNTFVRKPYKLSSVHRLRLTHGEEPAGPKLFRENTEQFLAKATANVNTKRKSLIRPIFSRNSRRDQQQHDERHQQSSRLTNRPFNEQQRLRTGQSKLDERQTPMAILPPIERLKSEKSVKSPTTDLILPPLESISTSSLYFHPSSLLETSDEENQYSLTAMNTPILETPDPTREKRSSNRRKDRERFFDAYERALAIARARRSFYDPYQLLGPSPTQHVLYSYFDRTPACCLTRGSACGHYGQKSIDYDRRSLSELARRRIYDEIVVDIRR